MAQNITLLGASYSDVPAVTLPKTGGGTARFDDTSDADATAGDIASGKTAYVNGVKLTGSVGIGTEGTPTATKGAVSNHSVNVTPSVTNTAGVISGGTHTGTAVTVTAAELASGTKSITQNGTGIDVTGYEDVDVNVQESTLVINLEYNTNTDVWEPDCTLAEIQAADSAGKTIVVKALDDSDYSDGGYYGMGSLWYWVLKREYSPVYAQVRTEYQYDYLGIHVLYQDTYIIPSGTKSITANGTGIDVTNYAAVDVAVPTGTSKNTQIVQGTTRTNASTLTAIGAELTVSKSGTYDIYYACMRTNTSTSYTWGTQLYIDGIAQGTENTTWTNNQQNTHLTSVSLTAGQKLRVYGRETRGTSYYVCAPMLAIVEA